MSDDEPRCGYCESPLPRGVFDFGECDCSGAEASRLRVFAEKVIATAETSRSVALTELANEARVIIGDT